MGTFIEISSVEGSLHAAEASPLVGRGSKASQKVQVSTLMHRLDKATVDLAKRCDLKSTNVTCVFWELPSPISIILC